MNALEFTEFLVKELVTKADLVSVSEFDEDEFKVIQVLVSNDDMPKVIGKDGSTINAIRTLVQSSSYVNNDKKIKINVDSF